MKKQRKIIVYIATSADGYIARADGSVDWLNRPRTAGDYGMAAFFGSIDAILWGRKTYEMSAGMSGGGGGFGGGGFGGGYHGGGYSGGYQRAAGLNKNPHPHATPGTQASATSGRLACGTWPGDHRRR